jgi:hypothetical protein
VQFSLGTILLLIAAASIPLAWMGRQVRHSEEELAMRRLAIQELTGIQARATGWSHEGGASHIVFEGTHFDGEALDQLRQTLARNPNVTDIAMYDTTASEGALAALQDLSRLEELQIQRSAVTADRLTSMAEMPTLRRLYANGIWIKLESRQRR